MGPQENFEPNKNHEPKWELFRANPQEENVQPKNNIDLERNAHSGVASTWDSFSARQASAAISVNGKIQDVRVRCETGALLAVLVGRGDTFGSAQGFSLNCETIKRAIADGRLKLESLDPSKIDHLRLALQSELDKFKATLEKLGAKVITPEKLATQEQMFPRDPLIVIGSKIIVSQMKERSRTAEFDGIRSLLDLDLLNPEHKRVVTPPSNVLIEGGDVMIHKGKIYVGVGGPRTSESAIAFLEKEFSDMTVVPLQLAPAKEGEDVLHLDCCLNFLGGGHVLMYPGGFSDPAAVRRELQSSEIIEVSHEEQLNFATNILSVTPNDIVSRPTTPIVNKQLVERGYTVHLVDFSTVELFGGSFRCATHPLWRGE